MKIGSTGLCELYQRFETGFIIEATTVHHSVEHRPGIIIEPLELVHRTDEAEKDLSRDSDLFTVDPTAKMEHWRLDNLDLFHLTEELRLILDGDCYDSSKLPLVDCI